MTTQSEERFKNIIRHLLAGDLDKAEEQVRTCGDDVEHEDFNNLNESLLILSAMCKIGIAIQAVKAEQVPADDLG